MTDKRFIEEVFPVREISEEAAAEKNIHHGHISTLHIWWARRPLASSRATAYSALIGLPQNENDLNKKKQFIVELSKWKNSLNKTIIKQAHEEILKANGGDPPKVLDPFAGGASLSLEALRLGCETYSSDYNPVSVLIQKCVLEYPQKYGDRLVTDVTKWAATVMDETKKEINRFYNYDKDQKKGYFGDYEESYVKVGYIWVRTIPCQNPSCKAEIPLMKQFWLAKKGEKKVALFPYVQKKEIKFKIVGSGYEKIPGNFNPDKGCISQAVASCLVCGSTIDANNTRKLFSTGKSGERMIAVVLLQDGKSGKQYRLPNDIDMKIFLEVADYLQKKRELLIREWGFDPVPDEPMPPKETLGFRVQRYGILKWGDLFNFRQKLALVVFVENVRKSYAKMLEAGYEKEYAVAVTTYLAFSISKLSDFNSRIARWANHMEKSVATFGRQALPMLWDYCEINPFSGSTGSWEILSKWTINSINSCLGIEKPAHVKQCSAINLEYDDKYFDAVFTDPPYYDNVPYSYLSDFFYVWLKRAIGSVYPDLFATPLTPKKDEIVAYSHVAGGFEEGKIFFENMLKKSFSEINRVLKPNGISVIVYAHKSTSGWETLINSLLDSGLVVTAAWPLHTEKQSRLRATESAALASSIYMITRKLEKIELGFYKEVKESLRKHLNDKLEKMWNEGISGADFFISAIGSSIEVFGKYKKIVDDSDNIISVTKLLNDTREIVTNHAIKKVLHGEFSDQISQMTRFYVLWRWAYGEANVPYDDANKLAHSVGLDLAHEWDRGFITKDKDVIRVLGPHERNAEELNESHELIDVLQYALTLWKKNNKEKLVKHLQEKGYSKSEMFKRVAQAISESLPVENTEKKWIDGFLTGLNDDTQSGVQTKLF